MGMEQAYILLPELEKSFGNTLENSFQRCS